MHDTETREKLPKELIDAAAQTGRDIIILDGGDGEDRRDAKAANCTVSYVNCRTKQQLTQTLTPGETFAYGDWDGSTCVRKVFNC